MGNFIKKIILKNKLLNNVRIIKSRLNSSCKLCAMVKANAYGHGLKEIVEILKNNVDFFGVANLHEALKVKYITNSSNILIVGRTSNLLETIQNDISFAIISKEQFEELLNFLHNYAKTYEVDLSSKVKIHIKINCGMNRFGINKLSEFKYIYKQAMKNNIQVEGVFTHFPCIENKLIYEKQKMFFNMFLKEIPNNQNPIVHIGGSGVILKRKNKKQIYNLPNIDINFNMVRVGILLYGYGDDGLLKGLKPVMKIESKIVNIIDVKKGEYVGYGTNFKAKTDMKIAVVPVGYADGLPRSFNTDGYLKVVCEEDGKKASHNCKITGNICMDLTMIDVTAINAKVGDRVIVLSDADSMARKLKTISYEILTNFSKLRT